MKKLLNPCLNVLLKNNSHIGTNTVGKNILITGGGSGIGKEIANVYSSLGGNVIIASRNVKKLENAANEIENDTKKKVHFHELNVKDHLSIVDLSNKLEKDKMYPDIIINNAAGNFLCQSEKLTYNGWNSIIDTVLKGTVDMTLEFGKNMIRNEKNGVFLNISTTYANTGSAYVLPSAIAKAGCDNMVKSLAAEWGKYGIRLLGVAPGPIYTEGAFSRLDPTGKFENEVKNSLPMGRLGEKREIANFVTYLTSDYANWMTGQIINFDGGEVVGNSGEFNKLLALSQEDWDNISRMRN